MMKLSSVLAYITMGTSSMLRSNILARSTAVRNAISDSSLSDVKMLPRKCARFVLDGSRWGSDLFWDETYPPWTDFCRRSRVWPSAGCVRIPYTFCILKPGDFHWSKPFSSVDFCWFSLIFTDDVNRADNKYLRQFATAMLGGLRCNEIRAEAELC